MDFQMIVRGAAAAACLFSALNVAAYPAQQGAWWSMLTPCSPESDSIYATVQAACESVSADIRARLYHVSYGCGSVQVTGRHRPYRSINPLVALCIVDTYIDGVPQQYSVAAGMVALHSSRHICPNGGTLVGANCVCPSGQRDTGTACVPGTCALYPDDTTTGCNKTTADMYATMPPPDDLRFEFHRNLTCGSETTCAARCRMDNCKWLEAVLPVHTDGYLRQESPWPQMMAECESNRSAGVPWYNIDCTYKIGWHHIHRNLLSTLVQFGCGTDADHNLVFEVAFSERSACMSGGGTSLRRGLSRRAIYEWRTYVRQQCLEQRQAAGLDPFINDDLRGQTCGN